MRSYLTSLKWIYCPDCFIYSKLYPLKLTRIFFFNEWDKLLVRYICQSKRQRPTLRTNSSPWPLQWLSASSGHFYGIFSIQRYKLLWSCSEWWLLSYTETGLCCGSSFPQVQKPHWMLRCSGLMLALPFLYHPPAFSRNVFILDMQLQEKHRWTKSHQQWLYQMAQWVWVVKQQASKVKWTFLSHVCSRSRLGQVLKLLCKIWCKGHQATVSMPTRPCFSFYQLSKAEEGKSYLVCYIVIKNVSGMSDTVFITIHRVLV